MPQIFNDRTSPNAGAMATSFQTRPASEHVILDGTPLQGGRHDRDSGRRRMLRIVTVGLLIGGLTIPAAHAQDDAEDAQPAAPAEDSPILVEPETPEKIFDTVVLLIDLARPGLARQYLEQLMAAEPDDDTLLRMRDKHGPGLFIKLSNIEALQPLSMRLLERVNAAFGRWADDPQRIETLISELNGTVREREAAIFQMRNIGQPIVPALLSRLARTGDPRERDELFAAIRRIGSPTVAPLLAAVHAPSDELRIAALQLLGFVGTRAVVESLWYPAFAPDQPGEVQLAARNSLVRILKSSADSVERITPYGVAAELQAIAARYYRGEHEWPLDDDGNVLLWSWRPEREMVAPERVSPEIASLYVGSRFAGQALALAPDNRETQALYLGLALSWDAHRAGSDQPLPTGPGTAHDLALTVGPEVVTTVLADALKHNNAAGALAALTVLGQIDAGHQLASKDGRSPVLAALNYPDPRVQFAAANTILLWEPKTSFPGASRVADILRRAVAADTSRHAVIVDSNAEYGGTLAGIVGELGYEPELATTGQAGFKAAAERGDVQLIVLQINITRWPLSQTIANLRADARTAYIPIAVYGEESHRHRIDELKRRYPMVFYIGESETTNDFDFQLRREMKSLRTPALTPEQRARQRATGTYWFARIADSRRTDLFNIAAAEDALFHAVNDPDLVGNALFALAAIPAASVQSRFEEVVLGEHFEPSVRRDAALQLAYHIQRHGLLLRAEAIAALKSARQSTSDPELATALAAVIGSMKPDAKLSGQRLQNHRPPTSPVPPVLTLTP
jgi:CheY-like chemotaxis protein